MWFWKCILLVNRTIIVTGAGENAAARQADEIDKCVTFRDCEPFVKCISGKNKKGIDNAKDTDVVMPMYNLIEYSDTDSKPSGSL